MFGTEQRPAPADGCSLLEQSEPKRWDWAWCSSWEADSLTREAGTLTSTGCHLWLSSQRDERAMDQAHLLLPTYQATSLFGENLVAIISCKMLPLSLLAHVLFPGVTTGASRRGVPRPRSPQAAPAEWVAGKEEFTAPVLARCGVHWWPWSDTEPFCASVQHNPESYLPLMRIAREKLLCATQVLTHILHFASFL